MSSYTIKYNDVDINVNPTIFAEKSETFSKFYHPDQSMTITGERSVEEFKQLLPYVQGTDATITIDNIKELESFAEEWGVQSLKNNVEKWKENNSIDVMLENFLENARARISVSNLIPDMANKINELLNKPKFLNVPPKLLNQILSCASKQEKIQNHHALYSFIMNFINQDQPNRLNLLNFINPRLLTPSEVEQFFESNLLPEDSYLLSQIPTFLTNLALLFQEKFQNEQDMISKIEADIQKQEDIYSKKNKECQEVKNQLADLQQQQRQLSKKPKPNFDDRRQKKEDKFSYTPSNSTSSPSNSTSFNNHKERGGRTNRGGRRINSLAHGHDNSSQQSKQAPNSNSNVSAVVMPNDVPPFYSMQMPPMNPQMQMPTNMNMQMPTNINMNVLLMSPAQIQEINMQLQRCQNQIKQIAEKSPLSAVQLQELQRYTQLCQTYQFQLDQQKNLQLYLQQQQQKPESNHSVSYSKSSQLTVQVPHQVSLQPSPIGAPLTSIHSSSSNNSAPNVTPLQVDKLVPSISVEKPKIKQKSFDSQQKAIIAESKKQPSVKIEKPLRGASIEFGKSNDDQT